MSFIEIHCQYCGQPFDVRREYAEFRIRNGKPAPKFCSRQCFGQHKMIKSPEQVLEIITCYQSGESSVSIGKRMGLCDVSVRNVLKRNSIPRRTQSELMLGSKNPTRGIGHTSETKALQSKLKSDFFSAESGIEAKNVLRQKTLLQIASGRMPKANTSIEITMSRILVEMQIGFIYQHPFGYWVFDFYLPKEKFFIECDGDYWHGNPALFPVQNATQRNNIGRGKQKESYARKHGYKLLRLWESEIKGDTDSLKMRIMNEIRE